MTPEPTLDLDAIEALDDVSQMAPQQRAAFVEIVTNQLDDLIGEIKTAWEPLAILARDPDIPSRDRTEAAFGVLHDVERLGYRMQATWQVLAGIAGVDERAAARIEKEAIEAEGKEMDAAAEARDAAS